MYNNIGLQQIITPRLSPYLWDIFGYCGGLITIFYYNKLGLIIFSCIYAFYGLLNILFDIFTVSFEYSNNIMPNYKELNIYSIYITNKKYILQDKNSSEPFKKINMIDNSKLNIEISLYVGNNKFIKILLYYIYLLGITKKNYTKEDFNNFKESPIQFV